MKSIKDAIKKGYKRGTVIQYSQGAYNDTLGRGEFEVNIDRIIKFEYPADERDCFDKRQFDTIYSEEDGWVKIVKQPN